MQKTILMDVDGVLVTGRRQDGAHLFTDLETDLGLALKTLQSGFFEPRWTAIVTGKKELLPELSEALATIAPHLSAQTLIDYWFANDASIDLAVRDAMRDLRSTGHKVFLATNQEHLRARYLTENLGLGTEVDGVFYSAAIGHRKPDPEFYDHIEAAIGSPAESLVLIDDTEANVRAARARNWSAVHWQPGMSVPAALAVLGL